MRAHHFLLLLMLSATWGGSFVLLRIATPAFGPWGLAGLRCLLATVVLASFMKASGARWPERAAWPRLAFVSLLTVVSPFVLFPLAAMVLPAGYSAVLNTTAPLFGMLSAAALGDERLTPRRLMGCAVGFVGVVLLLGLGPVDVSSSVVLGATACTVAAATYGLGANLMKRATTRHDALAVSSAVHLSAAVMLFIPAASAVPGMHAGWNAIAALLVLGTVTSGFMYWVSLRLMAQVPASAATASAFLIPFFGLAWGWLFLGEPVTPGMAPGCALVLAATLVVTGFNPLRVLKRPAAAT
jgi:drug/metabolite transporter (DMT)-like permease